ARKFWPDAGDIGEERSARRVELHADGVDAGFHHLIELLAEQRLIDVVLVLPDADRLWIYLDELRQWVLEAAGYGDGAASGQVEIRELLAGGLAGAVDAGAGFAHQDHIDVLAFEQWTDEALRLAPGGAVADRDGARGMPLQEGEQRRRCLLLLRLTAKRVDGDMGQEASGGIDGRHLAAGAKPRVDADHRRRSQRGGHEQVLQIAGKYA